METSPADLAVAFRSFARRADEAIRDADDDEARARAEAGRATTSRCFEEAARLVHAALDGDIHRDAEAIAARISATHADAWDDTTLQQLRDLAQQVARALRH